MITPRSLAPLLVALALAPAVSSTAWAGEVEKAEHTRISEEMRKLAARNAWSAVEANYQRLEELEKKGEVISYKEFMLGGESARALGDMTSARARVERASKVDPTKEALNWLSDVDANYGRVDISFDGKFQGERVLTATNPPFAPDQRSSVAFAAAQIASGKGYTGLLPAGEYSVAGQKVNVAIGGNVASLRVGPPPAAPKEPFKLAYVGPRFELGVAFTSAGEPSVEDGEVQAAGFGGTGPRLGVGLEVGLSKHFGVIAQVGYHSLFGNPDVEEVPEYLVAGDYVHFGYGWLAASVRAGKLWVAAGPVWGAGSGVVTGVAGSDEAGAEYQRLTGSITAGGAAGSLSYSIVDFGSLAGAVSLEGGAQTDSFRVYPWGQVAFTVAPATSRRKE